MLDFYIHLYDFGDAQIAQRTRSGRHGILGRILPRLCTGADYFRYSVYCRFILFGHDSPFYQCPGLGETHILRAIALNLGSMGLSGITENKAYAALLEDRANAGGIDLFHVM